MTNRGQLSRFSSQNWSGVTILLAGSLLQKYLHLIILIQLPVCHINVNIHVLIVGLFSILSQHFSTK